jgi:hypothetical protein
MTAAEALTALAPIVGSGGIVSVLLAWIGYKQQAGKGREDPAPAVSVAYGSAIPKSADIELLANAMTQLGSQMTRLILMLEAMERRHEIDDEAEKRLQARELTRLADELRRGHT